MGDPKKTRKKFTPPAHPWQKARIEQEKAIMTTYGLKNKREIWKLVSKLKGFSMQAKNLIASTSEQGKKEKEQLLSKLSSLNMLPENADLDSVLSLKPEDIIERRLQTLVCRKKLASSMKQARQYIVHGHVFVGDRKITVPSYLVRKEEEAAIRVVDVLQPEEK
ncbi:MAG: 30S ribosomal protein S4 [Candidatus Woesearchaeota archaeon]